MDGEYRIYFTRQETADSLKLAYLPFSQTRQINYIFTINRPIVYICSRRHQYFVYPWDIYVHNSEIICMYTDMNVIVYG